MEHRLQFFLCTILHFPSVLLFSQVNFQLVLITTVEALGLKISHGAYYVDFCGLRRLQSKFGHAKIFMFIIYCYNSFLSRRNFKTVYIIRPRTICRQSLGSTAMRLEASLAESVRITYVSGGGFSSVGLDQMPMQSFIWTAVPGGRWIIVRNNGNVMFNLACTTYTIHLHTLFSNI